jgi:hypothetical protein
MLVFIIVAAVLIGLAYADYCLVDNTEHFGICFAKAMQSPQGRDALYAAERLEAEGEARSARAESDVEVAAVAEVVATAGRGAERASGASHRPPVAPVPTWLLREPAPVLELLEDSP